MAELDRFQLRPGDPAPDFALPGTDGATHRLSEFSDRRLLLVVFWCNHCPYVQAWESRMIEIGRKYAAQGVATVLINSNDADAYPDDGPESMAHRAREKGYPFPYLRDETQEVAHAYGALVTPHPMLFGPDRRLLFQGRIDDDHQHPERVTHRYLETALAQALAGEPVAPAAVPVAGCTVKWKG
ncbi:MAG TPA: thioredoxin family protein [Thermoplasmata archaeon]|nr:thioredoxin family protein [Thermoplasmata archaeon]